jgi:pimeloyl-ACP methyl ester carboxylesterase
VAFQADLSDADRRFLARDGRGAAVVQSFVEALRQGPDGVVDDYRIPAEAWGFDLAEVRGKVDLWHGDADRVVPLARAEDLATALPHATLHRLAGQGHISIQDHLGAVLDGMLGAAPG